MGRCRLPFPASGNLISAPYRPAPRQAREEVNLASAPGMQALSGQTKDTMGRCRLPGPASGNLISAPYRPAPRQAREEVNLASAPGMQALSG